MKKYYLKKLTPQELGYRAGKPGGGGRYFYISKDCLDFFPPLSETVLNDSVILPVIPPFSDNKVYTKFVYHNDKHAKEGGTRDEYRLYLNKEIDPDGSFYKAGDIIAMERRDEEAEGELVPIYSLYRFEESDDRYAEFDKIIEESQARGGHALYSGDLGLEDKFKDDGEIMNVIIPVEVKEEIESKLSAGEEEMGAHLFNSISFRDFVLNSYGNKCAITKKSIAWKNLSNLEAAHIKPKSHRGTFLPCNGIALSRDMHWAFDKGFISIDDDYKVVVHDEVRNTMLKEFNGQLIDLPREEFFKPSKEYLKHHREKVFGLFLHSGSLRSL